jgi:hypothetical protein
MAAGINYAVLVDGVVVGSRTSASGRAYTNAVVLRHVDGTHGVVSYHSTSRLAFDARMQWAPRFASREPGSSVFVVPVAITARRAKVGDIVVAQGVL